MRQAFKTVDVARLEVEVDAVSLKNYAKNPDGRLGGWGWWTPVAGTVIETPAPPSIPYLTLRNSTGGALATNAQTESIPCTPGKYASGRIDFGARTTTNETVRLRMVFLGADGETVVGTGGQSAVTNSGVVYAPTAQAPAGTAFVRLRIDAYTSGGNLGAARYVVWDETMVAISSVSGALTGYAYVEPIIWSNILGPTHEIQIDRSELNVGVLSATVLDATLDPSTATTLRPGRAVRVTVLDPTDNTWKPIFTGTTTKARTTYDFSRKTTQRVRVMLEAADNVKTLANVPRPRGVAGVPDLRAVLEGAGVPWNVNGHTGHSPTAIYFTRNESASALDQVAITRDSQLGYAWVDRRGVITVNSEGTLPSDFAASFADADYTALDVDFDTERCVNTVTVKLLRINAASGDTVEVPYGPYVDAASVDEWGSFSREFTVQGLGDDSVTIGAYAQSILAANATPQVRVNSLTFPIRLASQMTSSRALLDLYDRASVEHNSTDDSRITGIRHSITPDKWLVTLSFAAEGGVAPPTSTPAVVNAVTAPSGWQSLDHEGGNGTLRYAVAGGVVFVEASIGAISVANNTSFELLDAANAIPPAYRPSQGLNLLTGRVNAGTELASIARRADGTIAVTNRSGGAATSVQFAYSYLIG